MAIILLNNEGTSDTAESVRTYNASAVGEQFFLINESDAVVTFNVTGDPAYSAEGAHHSTASNGSIVLQPDGFVEFEATVAGSGTTTVTTYTDTGYDVDGEFTIPSGATVGSFTTNVDDTTITLQIGDVISDSADGSNTAEITHVGDAGLLGTRISLAAGASGFASGDSIYLQGTETVSAGGPVVFENFKARHGTSGHEGDELFIVNPQ